MTRPVLTPVVMLRHAFADPSLCAFRDGGIDTTWMGQSVITYGPPAVASKSNGPKDRSNTWAQTLVSEEEDGTFKMKLLFNMGNQGIPSDFGSDWRSRSAMSAASWFMGCTKPDDPKWPAIWDLAPHMLTPFPYTASDGYPLAFTQEGKHSPVPQVRTLSETAQVDDSIQPWFVIGWDAMSAHERLRVQPTFTASIMLHARVNRWDDIYHIADPLFVP